MPVKKIGNKRYYFTSFVIFFALLIYLGFVFLNYSQYQKEKINDENYHKQQDKILLNSDKNREERRLSVVFSDLEILGSFPSLKDFLSSGSIDNKNKVEELFLSFSQQRGVYDQIRFLDTQGQEIIRVNFNNGEPGIVPKEQLQNKKDRYYFQEAIALAEGEVYISPLDLNIEGSLVEVPYKPMLRVATPIFYRGEKMGVIVLNYLAEEIIHDLRSLAAGRGGKFVYLVDSKGYWLVSPNREEEWGFMFPEKQKINLPEKKPELWDLLKNNENGQLILSDGLYTFSTIKPLPANDQVVWKVYRFTPSEVLYSGSNRAGERMFLINLIIFLFLLLMVLMAYFLFKRLDKQIEATVIEQKKYFTLIKNIPGVAYRCKIDKDWTMEFISDPIEEITGFKATDFLGNKVRSFSSIIYPEDRQLVEDEIKKGIEKNENYDIEYRLLKVDGDLVWVKERGGAIYDWYGRPLFLDGVIFDISKDKEILAEVRDKSEELEKQKKAILNILEDVEQEKKKVEILANDLEKFKMAVDNVSDHIVITDPEGIVLYGNKVVEKITGYTLKEALGRKAGSLWRKPMAQEYYEKLWLTIKTSKKPFFGQITNVRKNGEEYEASISISPVLNNSGKVIYFVGIERDITQEKAIDRAKTEFVSLASHQLRTPLSTINWYAEMLLNGDAGKLQPEQTNYLEEIYRGNQRMVDLVNSLLNVSRMELGTFVVDPVDCDLKEIVDEVIKELTPRIKTKKQKFNLEYDVSLSPMKLDKKLMHMVLENLLSNAVKYTPEKGQIGMLIGKNKNNLEIKVSDTGMGIPFSQQDKIFTKLFRADNVRTTDAEGTGLGLYLVKNILEHSGGKINFVSQENKGTTFTVILPLSGMKKKIGTKSLT